MQLNFSTKHLPFRRPLGLITNLPNRCLVHWFFKMAFEDIDLRYLHNQVAYLASLVLHFMTRDVGTVKARHSYSSAISTCVKITYNFTGIKPVV